MMKYWLKKIVELLFIAIIVVVVCGTYWGMWGKISRPHYDLLLNSLLPWQKQELANAMNYYYGNNIVVKYSTGYLLRCKASSESITRQYNWFYRNAISATASEMPAYHKIVVAAYRSIEKSPPDLSRRSTMELELAIAAKCHNAAFMTNKDISDIALSAVSLGIRIVAYSVNPILGASLTVIGLINAARSDISKAIPGIICFMQIRCRNFSYSVILLWGFFALLIFHFDRSPKKQLRGSRCRTRKVKSSKRSYRRKKRLFK